MRVKSILFLLLPIGLLLVSCGYNGVSTTGSSPTTPETRIASTSIAEPRITPIRPLATPSANETPGSGGVIVRTSASLYHTGAALLITVSNQTAQAILFPNHQTNCTVVLLQRQVGSSWQPMAPCKLMIVTKIFSLDAGKSLSVSLKAPPAGWPAGVYRVAFNYEGNVPTSPRKSFNAFSPLFRVE